MRLWMYWASGPARTRDRLERRIGRDLHDLSRRDRHARITLHSTQPLEAHEFQESILILGPGQTPQDVIGPEALTMANMAGEEHTYSWAEGPPSVVDKPDRCNIQLINTRSETRPFVIVSMDHASPAIYGARTARSSPLHLRNPAGATSPVVEPLAYVGTPLGRALGRGSGPRLARFACHGPRMVGS
jgi:hypothetical protein